MSNIIAAEQKFLNGITPSLRGYHLMLVGNQRPLEWIPKNRLHNFNISPENNSNIIGEYEKLPLRSNSVDIAVVAYQLENINHPETLLSELHRCLISQGKLFIFAQFKLHPFNWGQKALSVFKLKNLLTQTDFEINKINFLYYGSVLIIQAQKNTPGTTPLRATWEKKSVLDSLEDENWQPTPTTREIHD